MAATTATTPAGSVEARQKIVTRLRSVAGHVRGVERMVEEMERWFGSCTNHGECYEACPKEISLDFIALMNRDYRKSKAKQRRLISQT